jgi:octaprenyl-diphosphate synthase
MTFIDTIRQPILHEMHLFQEAFQEALYTDNPLLMNVNNYVLQKKGKQLRPMLVFLSAKICGTPNHSTIDGALSLELLHTASLIHDDVVDDSVQRRGKPSVNAHWNNKIAILSGDYMLSKSLFCATRTNNLEILKQISNIGMQLSDGELLQLMNTQEENITEENYLNVIKKKTALLFASCAQVGGLSVHAEEDKLLHLRNFGEYLGICFQIKDDIFDFSENTQIGKPTGNDIRDSKITLPLIYALRIASDTAKKPILKWIADKDFTPEHIETIIRFAHTQGGVLYSQEIMEQFKNKAIQELHTFEDSPMKQALIQSAEFATEREL